MKSEDILEGLADLIADKVAAKLGAAAPAAATEKAAAAPKKDAKAGAGKKADEAPKRDAEADKKRAAEVLALVKETGEKHGRDVAKGVVTKFAATFAEVKPEDFDALEAALKAVGEDSASEDEDY